MKFKAAQITKYSYDSRPDSDWVISCGGEELGSLPSKLNEHEAMSVLRLLRNVEADAFTKGRLNAYNSGKDNKTNELEMQVSYLKETINNLTAENIRLADMLENAIGG